MKKSSASVLKSIGGESGKLLVYTDSNFKGEEHTFTDTAGNTSALIREREGALNYSFKQLRQAPVQTNFSIIGF